MEEKLIVTRQHNISIHFADQIHAPLVINHFGFIVPVDGPLATTTHKGLKIQSVRMLIVLSTLLYCWL